MDFYGLGFETCGNATLIVYEAGVPVLATDPWIEGNPYFGSWSMPYKLEDRQIAAIENAKFLWLSHGHPDHINPDSLARLKNSTFLIPAHCNGRIASDLNAQGIRAVQVKSNEWVSLSGNIRLMTFPDWNQDAACLIAVGSKSCILNLNDGSALGSAGYIKKHLSQFRTRFCLGLINYNDADMFNIFDEGGTRINPQLLGIRIRGSALGRDYASLLQRWGGTHTAPFSCNHYYARTDSEWASAYETPYDAHGAEFDKKAGEFLPGYFNYSAGSGTINVVEPVRQERMLHDPAAYGDDWSEALEQEDRSKAERYFKRFSALDRKLGFINLRVGNSDNVIRLRGPRETGITFETPRHSLMMAIEYNIFDDLLIGNFVKTTLHGGIKSLYPDFTPYVAKYGDNGLAHSESDLNRYFTYYRELYGFHYWLSKLEFDVVNKVRPLLSDHPARPVVRKLYRACKTYL